jgi:SAM-dependent methyltransferase
MAVRRLVYAPLDLWDFLTGRRAPLTPPRGMIYTGSGDFVRQGRQFLEYFIEYGGLQPHHAVLDVGSGIGRMAVPLTQYLDATARYEGFDVVQSGVKWCSRHISRHYPHFRFRYIPLKNDLYTAGGEEASDFAFPYAADSFDLVILTSVFTHMLPDQVAHYLAEIQRVLRPGGRVFATFFLITCDNEAAAGSAGRPFSFPHDHGHYRLMSERVRSANVAYREDYLREVVRRTGTSGGLRIREVHYGSWCGRSPSESLDFQDVVILEKG